MQLSKFLVLAIGVLGASATLNQRGTGQQSVEVRQAGGNAPRGQVDARARGKPASGSNRKQSKAQSGGKADKKRPDICAGFCDDDGDCDEGLGCSCQQAGWGVMMCSS